MRRVQHGLLALIAACSMAFVSVACDDTRQGAREDANDAAERADDAAEDAARARDEGRDTASDAGAAIGAAAESFDVKAALMADDTVDASDINVDTNHQTKTVVLKGTVASAEQKAAAARIASREAEGYTIDNQLTVRAR